MLGMCEDTVFVAFENGRVVYLVVWAMCLELEWKWEEWSLWGIGCREECAYEENRIALRDDPLMILLLKHALV